MGATKINLEVDEKVFFFLAEEGRKPWVYPLSCFLVGIFNYLFFRLSSVDCVDFSNFLAFFSLFTFQFASFVLYF